MLLPLLCAMTSAASQGLSPVGALPSSRQLAWHRNEYYAFVHFGPNTFTGNEWGSGKESAEEFNPTHLDCRQWCREFKKAGMAGVIITAKHHDGFCLWPSRYSRHTVAQSKWMEGKGDVLKELSTACKETGLKFGVYLSPWDRNHPTYGTPEYNEVFRDMLGEVLTKYGPVFEVWFDGANGEGPNGKRQIYDWNLFYQTVRTLQPNACIFSDGGPDVRWVGNEEGHAAPTNWCTLHRNLYSPGHGPTEQSASGHMDGEYWVPAECDVSIRPGWFYKAAEDAKVKSVDQLEELYYESVGQNANLLLNVPAGPDGLIHKEDIDSLMGLRARLDETFKTDLALGKRTTGTGTLPGYDASSATAAKGGTFWAGSMESGSPALTVDLGRPTLLDRVLLQEQITLGQRIKKFAIEAMVDGDWAKLADGTTIGYKRILRTAAVRATKVRLTILESKDSPTISTFAIYASPNAKYDVQRDTGEQHDARMAWWREARFGMFIHWGLYALPAGAWNGKDYEGAAEWLMYTAHIPVADYTPLEKQFDPEKFNAKEWVSIAKRAGMKYIVITSKHHEGFAMFDSKLSDYTIAHTRFKRDVLKELAQACEEAGLKLCFYHSIMDWHHPDYLPRRPWDPRPDVKADFERYIAYMKGQLKELLTDYGPIGVLWFDGEWEASWTHERGKDLYAYVRGLQPSIIVNNRVDTGRNDMQGMTKDKRFFGDFGTPEQEIPPGGLPGVDWESCMTMNDTWGFSAHDHNWKSADTLIKNLVDIASKGGNYLLNVGPTSEGLIPPESVDRLATVGDWMAKNGEAIYGTKAGPFLKPLPWGRVTQNEGKLYLCVFEKAEDGTLLLPGISADVMRLYPMGDRETELSYGREKDGLRIHIGTHRPSPVDVYVMEVRGTPTVAVLPTGQEADGSIKLTAAEADIHGSTARLEPEKNAIGFWTQQTDWVSWNVRIEKPGDFDATIELACDPGSAGSEFEIAAGAAKVTGKVPATKSWNDFIRLKLGRMSVARGGVYSISVKATTKPGAAVMNLRSVTFRLNE